MSPIPDDFEQLRRLLALKRHEQPPPGYFHGFSRHVIVRIQAGELGDAAEASLWSFSGGSLLQRIWATLDARPVLAGAFGVAVCGFFVVGALLSDNGTKATAATSEMPNQATTLVNARVPAPVWEPKTETEISSIGAVLPNPQAGSLFKEIEARQLAQPVPAEQVDFRLRLSHP